MLGVISAFAYRHRETKNFELAISKLVLETAAGDWGRFCVLQTGRFSSGARFFGCAVDRSLSRRWITATRQTLNRLWRCHTSS